MIGGVHTFNYTIQHVGIVPEEIIRGFGKEACTRISAIVLLYEAIYEIGLIRRKATGQNLRHARK